MKYEVITDKDDMLVLVVHSRVIAISSDMSTIARLMQEDYANCLNKTRKLRETALIHPELDNDMYKEEKVVIIKKETSIKEPDGNSLGKLFNL